MHFVKRKAVIITLFIVTVSILGYSGIAAALNEPGSSGDPLVTRSFVEKYVQELLGQQGTGSVSLEWNVATLEAGQEFIGKAGTEFIVRSGEAVIVDPSGSGIPDLTAGTNVLAGQVAQNNHLFSIPRTDGRGIRAQKQTIIMYRGY